MRRLSQLLLLPALILGLLATPLVTTAAQADDGVFTRLEGFAIKTGFRGVFSWSASEPVLGVVHYGTDPDNLDKSAQPLPGAPDTSQMVVVDGLTIGSTIYWQVEDTVTGDLSDVRSFKAANAYNAWNAAAGSYTINLLVALDTQALQDDIPYDLAVKEIAQGMSIFGERLYDATDKRVRLGKVLVTDTNLDYAANVPNTPTIALSACAPQGNAPQANLADVIVQTSVPFDSHTYSGFAIASPCISFYVGRIGQLVVPWESDLHLGYISLHELSHYAFNAPDLYPVGQVELPADPQCIDTTGTTDVSVMNNTGGWQGSKWFLTEYDRSQAQTPCDMGNPAEPFTWDAMRVRYPNIPHGPIDHVIDDLPRGNPDGGILELITLDREPGASSLATYLPIDGGGGIACTNQGPQLLDPEGDANTALGTSTPRPSDDELDITSAYATWDGTAGAQAVSLHVKLKDLKATHAAGSNGEFFDYRFGVAGKSLYVNMVRSDIDGLRYELGEWDGPGGLRDMWVSNLTGSFDDTADVVSIKIPLSVLNTQLAAHGYTGPAVAEESVISGFEVDARRDVGGIVPDADLAIGQCPYRISQELDLPNQPPIAVADTATTVEGVGVLVDVLANDSDPDLDTLQLVSVGTAGNGATSVLGGKAFYVPSPTAAGSDSFTYVVGDGTGNQTTGTVTVTVNPAPKPPVAVADVATLPGSGGSVAVLANDSDPNPGDSLVVTGVTNGARGTVTTNGTTVTYTPTAAGYGTDSFTYTVTDGTFTRTSTVRVINGSCLINESTPLAAQKMPTGWSTQHVGDGGAATWDVRPDALTHSGAYAFSSSAESVALKDDRLVSPVYKIGGKTTLRFWHRYAFESTFDGGVLEASLNNGKTWADIEALGGEFLAGGYDDVINATSTGAIPGRRAWTGASFIDADTEVFVDLSALANKAIRLRWRLVTDEIIPGTGVPGWWVDDIDLVDATALGCASGANLAPVAADDDVTGHRSQLTSIAPLGNDYDPDQGALRITSVTAPSNGTATISADGLKVSYVPTVGYNGPDSFGYTVFDGRDSAAATVRVNTISTVRSPLDLDGDKDTELAVFRPHTGEWIVKGSPTVVWGGPGDIPVAADYNGDRKTDLAYYRPTDGTWAVKGGSTTVLGGEPGDVPVPADYDGDGDADLAVFRPTTGEWIFVGRPTVVLGKAGDVPVPADYDGDGDADLAIHRQRSGEWLIQGRAAVILGSVGERPVPADYDGDGDVDLAVYRESTGAWTVLGKPAVTLGGRGYVPQPGDYNGDGKLEFAVHAPGNGEWRVNGKPKTTVGGAGDVAVVLPASQR